MRSRNWSNSLVDDDRGGYWCGHWCNGLFDDYRCGYWGGSWRGRWSNGLVDDFGRWYWSELLFDDLVEISLANSNLNGDLKAGRELE